MKEFTIGVDLSRSEIRVLDKGLKFAPKCNLSKFDTYIDIRRYIRKLNIQKYMLNKPIANSSRRIYENRDIVNSQLRNKSLFNLSIDNNEHVDVFNQIVLQDLEKLRITKIRDPQDI